MERRTSSRLSSDFSRSGTRLTRSSLGGENMDYAMDFVNDNVKYLFILGLIIGIIIIAIFVIGNRLAGRCDTIYQLSSLGDQLFGLGVGLVLLTLFVILIFVLLFLLLRFLFKSC